MMSIYTMQVTFSVSDTDWRGHNYTRDTSSRFIISTDMVKLLECLATELWHRSGREHNGGEPTVGDAEISELVIVRINPNNSITILCEYDADVEDHTETMLVNYAPEEDFDYIGSLNQLYKLLEETPYWKKQVAQAEEKKKKAEEKKKKDAELKRIQRNARRAQKEKDKHIKDYEKYLELKKRFEEEN